MNTSAEIIVIGNEILNGDVLDTNSHWLCKQLTGLGALVLRVCQVRDHLPAITEALRSALKQSSLIITTGGLGPTDDDLTLEAVAQALERELELNPQAFSWVQEKYQEFAQKGYVASAEMTPERTKMARLPHGAIPLPNKVGAAPGVLLREGKQIIVCLPGVPAELKDIFQGALLPTLQALFGAGAFAEWRARVACGDESALAPLLRKAVEAHPRVYIKSRAKRFGPDVTFIITLAARGQTREEAFTLLEDAWQTLSQVLHRAGIAILALER